MDLENSKSTTAIVIYSQSTHLISIEPTSKKPFIQDQHSRESSFVCKICYNDYSENEMKMLECKHSFCLSCLNEYLTNKINTNKILNIPCPEADCGKVIKDSFIKSIIGDEWFKKYLELALKKFSHQNTQQKFCPKPGCSKPYYPKQNKEYTVCVCNTQICNICSNFWHPNKSCLEAIEPEFEEYVQKNEIKFCIMCKTAIQRVEGCTHMTCSICDYEWCWKCGREYTRRPPHKCLEKWSPLPPSIATTKCCSIKDLSSVWKIVFMRIHFKSKITKLLVLPLMFLFFLLVWPFFIFFKHNIDIEELKQSGSITQITISIALGIVFLPILLLMFLFFVLKIICKLGQNNRKRWRTRNSQNFIYTDASKPSIVVAPTVQAPITTIPRALNNNTRARQLRKINPISALPSEAIAPKVIRRDIPLSVWKEEVDKIAEKLNINTKKVINSPALQASDDTTKVQQPRIITSKLTKIKPISILSSETGVPKVICEDIPLSVWKKDIENISKKLNIKTKNEAKIESNNNHRDKEPIGSRVEKPQLEPKKLELLEKLRIPSPIRTKLCKHIEEAKRNQKKEPKVLDLKTHSDLEKAENHNVIIIID